MIGLPHMHLVLMAFWVVLAAVIRCVDATSLTAAQKAAVGLLITALASCVLWHFYGPALRGVA